MNKALKGALVGAVIGSVLGIVIVVVADRLIKGAQDDSFWLPTGAIAGLIGGAVIGMLVSQILIGGQETERANREAQEAIEAAQDAGPSAGA